MGTKATPLQLLTLPDIVLEKILSYLPYDEISKNRLVCKTFDHACKKQLNRGLKIIERRCIEQLNTVKNQLPRRESERINHPLKPHYNVLAHMKAKISVLSHTYKDYMDLNLGCFIPGKVIDEASRVLRCLKAVKIIPYYNEILQEFLDISSMAVEHFREEITRDVEQCLHQADSYESLELSNEDDSRDDSSSNTKIILSFPPNFNTQKLSQTFKKINNRLKRNHKTVICMKGQLNEVKWKMKKQSLKMKRQSLKIQEYFKKMENFDVNVHGYVDKIQKQDLVIQENAKKIKSQNLKLQRCAKKIQDQDVQIADITKHLDYLSQKVRNLNVEASRSDDEMSKLREPGDQS